MMKYTIKNCPSCKMFNVFGQDDKPCCYYEMKYCEDVEDCLLKQIVEKCLDYPKRCEIEGNCLDNRLCSTCFFGGGCELAQDILSELEIEECEE